MRDDAAAFLEAEWIAPRPHSDTAIMMGLAHTLVVEELYDAEFLASHCVGFERFREYLLGRDDGIVKDAEWASRLSEIPAETIRSLARRMARERSFIIVNWSLQRADHGEQPFWAAIALAAMLGQIGLPGGGFGFGYGSMEGLAGLRQDAPTPSLPIGHNAVSDYIPVARISDLLLNPGAPFQYDGHDLNYADIKLVYWCGGNPFHHHQDLNRLIRAWRKPDTMIVNEAFWTATARHSDIVLPATMTLERNDLGGAARDRFIVAMKQAICANGPRAQRLRYLRGSGRAPRACANSLPRIATRWVGYVIYMRPQASTRHRKGCDGTRSMSSGSAVISKCPSAPRPIVLYEKFRADPISHRLPTPSGRIEIFSQKIAGFHYDDCPGHPAWMEPAEWLGSAVAKIYPLHLMTTQPATRLHGQMDMGRVSQESKVAGREPIRINPDDAKTARHP